MDESKFWTIIGHARTETEDSADPDEDFLDTVIEKLEDLSAPEVAAFQHIMEQQDAKLFSHNVTGALHIIKDGQVEPEDFEGFRGWIISQGREIFAKVVKNADGLADDDVVPDMIFLPDMLTIAADYYEEINGEEVPKNEKFSPPEDLAGEPWTVKDLKKRYPRLAEEFVL